jgi:pyruvate/2-oxoglutarate/acetoin dehydrogenase E1 component
MKKVQVNWHDAWSYDEQCNIDVAEVRCIQPLNVETIGYMVAEDENCIVIARDYLEADNKVCGIMHIPKGWIDEPIKELP